MSIDIGQKLSRLFVWLLCGVSPRAASRYLYRERFGVRWNEEAPDTLNAKLMWLKLNTYYKNPLITRCSDKYAARGYVLECGCGEILSEVYCVHDRAKEIDFDRLPEKFVLKCNHGCGYNIICTDKAHFDRAAAVKKLSRWLREPFWRRFAETNYRYIKRKVYAEAYIETDGSRAPDDYKFYCFSGRATHIMLCCERENRAPRYYFFDRDWNLLRINPDGKAAPEGFTLPRPKHLEAMLDYAERLSKPFPFVRVDLYDEGRVLFGELTFTPGAALDAKRLPEADEQFCALLDIDRLR